MRCVTAELCKTPTTALTAGKRISGAWGFAAGGTWRSHSAKASDPEVLPRPLGLSAQEPPRAAVFYLALSIFPPFKENNSGFTPSQRGSSKPLSRYETALPQPDVLPPRCAFPPDVLSSPDYNTIDIEFFFFLKLKKTARDRVL